MSASRSTHAASWIARAWVRVYTSGMPIALREVRRAEIDCDLWDQERDGLEGGEAPSSVAISILLRMAFGIPDDLAWRVEAVRAYRAENPIGMSGPPVRSQAMGMAAVVAGSLLSGWLITLVLRLGMREVDNVDVAKLVDSSGPLGKSMLGLGMLVGAVLQISIVARLVRHGARGGRMGVTGLCLLLLGFATILLRFALLRADEQLGMGWEYDAVLFLGSIPGTMLLLPAGYLLLASRMPPPSRRIALVVGMAMALSGIRDQMWLWKQIGSGAALSPPFMPPLWVVPLIVFYVTLAAVGFTAWRGVPSDTVRADPEHVVRPEA